MATIFIRLPDMSIAEIPAGLVSLIPVGAIVVNPLVKNIVVVENDKKCKLLLRLRKNVGSNCDLHLDPHF